jgi:hypothetical protein
MTEFSLVDLVVRYPLVMVNICGHLSLSDVSSLVRCTKRTYDAYKNDSAIWRKLARYN